MVPTINHILWRSLSAHSSIWAHLLFWLLLFRNTVVWHNCTSNLTHDSSLSSWLAKVWNWPMALLRGETDLSTQWWGMFLLYIVRLSAACKSAQLEARQESNQSAMSRVIDCFPAPSRNSHVMYTWFTEKTQVQIHKKLKPRDLPVRLIYHKLCPRLCTRLTSTTVSSEHQKTELL